MTYVYDDIDSISFSLTPAHLIYGRRITTMPNSQHHEIVTTYNSLTRKARHQRKLLDQIVKNWRNEYLLALRDQAMTKSRGNRNPEITVGDILVIRNDQTKRNFSKLVIVEQLMPELRRNCPCRSCQSSP